MFEELVGSGLLLHHWDTDGICSTRLLLERFAGKNLVNKTPELGNYFLTAEELVRYSSYDYVLVVDMALPEENIQTLAKKAKVLIFDHHLQKQIPGVFHHNPISQGKSPADYPSASWIVNEYLGNAENLFAILGIIGDFEQRIQTNKKFSSLISAFCQQNNLAFDDLIQMVYLLDSNYKVGDRRSVEEAPCLLLKNAEAQSILANKKWKKNLSLLEKEITKQIQTSGEERQGILLKTIHTSYNIISTVTRRIAWNQKKDTVVVNTGFFKDQDQIYVRSKKDLQPLIQKGKSFGFKCGGKTEVMGAVVPKEKTDDFVQEILRFLS